MNLSALILKWLGWKVEITVPDFPKAIICVAPHTSNMDFIIGKLAYASVGRKAGFLMKKSWFFFPLGIFFRAIGGVPVDRRRGAPSLVEALIDRFKNSDRLVLAITPEGTRSRVTKWHTGFLRIAYATGVPVVLGAIDFANKKVVIQRSASLSGDIDKDMAEIKRYYSRFTGRHPEKFAV